VKIFTGDLHGHENQTRFENELRRDGRSGVRPGDCRVLVRVVGEATAVVAESAAENQKRVRAVARPDIRGFLQTHRKESFDDYTMTKHNPSNPSKAHRFAQRFIGGIYEEGTVTDFN
jgi:hypothetical protein